MEKSRTSLRTHVERFEGEVDRITLNTLSGFIRIMGVSQSIQRYVELRSEIEEYSNPRDPKTALFLARSAIMGAEAEIVGFVTARVSSMTNKVGVHVDQFFVPPTARGFGHAVALDEQVREFASENNAGYIRIDHEKVDNESRSWLASRGYDAKAQYPILELE